MKYVIYLAGAFVIGLAVYLAISQTAVAPTPIELENNTEATTTRSYTFYCPTDEEFSITYTNNADEAILLLEGDMAYQLERAVSASGARYTSADESVVFWEHQGEATVEMNGVTRYQNCTLEKETQTETNNSDLSNMIRVVTPVSGATVSSPIALAGEARGYWFFEASAPVVVTDWDGKIIGEGYVTADDNWMTEDFVSFSGTVTYDLPAGAPYRAGSVIFKRDNPSGLPENDAAIEVPVTFQ